MKLNAVLGNGMDEKPLWTPSVSRVQASLLYQFKSRMEQKYALNLPAYDDIWHWSCECAEIFWPEFWDFAGVIGEKGDLVIQNPDKMTGGQFFPHGFVNWAENMLKIKDDSLAIVFRDEKARETQLTYKQLNEQVAALQQFLLKNGVKKGDRVAGMLPNMPQTLIGALAASSIGAIWSSASPDFGVQGLLDRFGQIEPKIFMAVDGYYYNGKVIDCREKVAAVVPQIKSIEKIVMVDFASLDCAALNAESYNDIVKNCAGLVPQFERVEFNHPLFIMFSSGTTGIPKCIVHGHGGTLQTHLKEHQLQSDIKRGDRVFYFTTCGWMMWQWLISAMASGAILLLYDGSPFYPNGEVLWDYTSKHGCTLFGTSAKYIDALKVNHIEPAQKFDLSALRTLASTGSPLVHESFDYIYQHIKADLHVESVSGGTDIVACFLIGNPLEPVWRGELQCAGLGFDMDVFDEHGKPMVKGSGAGEMVCKKPFPSMPVAFWNDADGSRYKKAYFENFDNIWCHGDWMEKTAHGGYIIHGRSDATLNPGGVRIGTAEIYRQVEQVPEVVESIAVGQDWDGDVRVVLFVKLREGIALNDEIMARIKKQIKDGTTPRHVPAKIIQIADIPRTKSNKIVELAVREVIHGRPVKNIEALANPEALDLYKDLADLKT